MLHVKGAEADGTLANLLKAQGFDVRSAVLYDVAAVPELPQAARDMLVKKKIDAALFFSARSAQIFKDAATGLPLETVIALCISDSTAEALAPLSFRSVRVADGAKSGRAVGAFGPLTSPLPPSPKLRQQGGG